MAFTPAKSIVLGKCILPSVCLFLVLFLTTAFAPGQEDQGLEGLLADIKDQKIMNWELEGFEEENGNNYQLRIWADGSYEETEDDQVLGGLWTIDKRDDNIVFLLKTANGYDLNGENPPIFYQVEYYGADKLILLWKAEGNIVRKVYNRLPTPFRG
ncbi:MAG: hypothetical protein AAF696_36555 [Bacteroidota bacterium]